MNDKYLLRFSDQRHTKHNYQTSLKYLQTFKNKQNLFLKIILNKSLIEPALFILIKTIKTQILVF